MKKKTFTHEKKLPTQFNPLIATTYNLPTVANSFKEKPQFLRLRINKEIINKKNMSKKSKVIE